MSDEYLWDKSGAPDPEVTVVTVTEVTAVTTLPVAEVTLMTTLTVAGSTPKTS